MTLNDRNAPVCHIAFAEAWSVNKNEDWQYCQSQQKDSDGSLNLMIVHKLAGVTPCEDV